MGDAKRRGSYEARLLQAVRAGRTRPVRVIEDTVAVLPAPLVLTALLRIGAPTPATVTARQLARLRKRRKKRVREALRRKTLGVLA